MIEFQSLEAIPNDQALFTVDAGPEPQNEMLAWMTRLRLLNGVPFSYLIPHERFLPIESIRFFYIDRNWTDAAVDGALSVGTITSKDRAQLHSIYARLRAKLDETERQEFQRRIKVLPTLPVFARGNQRGEVMTGFLLRSRAVSGWPGLHVNAWTDRSKDTRVNIMRIERLAPAVLLVLFDGIPGFMTLTEPRQGIQFGVIPSGTGRRLRIRDDRGSEIGPDVAVPFREDSPGVIHFQELSKRMLANGGDVEGDGVFSSAELGLQTLRWPFEQEFGDPADDDGGGFEMSFVATYPLELLRLTHELET
ncbi:MAG: hypothetical protein OER95_18275 [Acidimicrobiia bacterium]|nr:hypothetical protein [Acidimicrobiia bacterium]